MKKWDYGGAYLRHDMAGEIRTGTGVVKVHDIFQPLPDFMREADCLFVDPPCSIGNLKTFYTKADIIDQPTDFSLFAARLFQVIAEIAPKRAFVEVFKSDREDFERRLRSLYPCVRVYSSTYYHSARNRCWIIQGTAEPEDWGLEGMDEEDAIVEICARVPFDCIADPCMGRGLVGWNAYLNGRRFVGTELNEKRLAVLVEKIAESKGEGKR